MNIPEPFITSPPGVMGGKPVPLEEIFGQGENIDEGIAIAYLGEGYRMREIAEHLGVHYATVSRRLRRWESKQKK